ncbi:MAG: sigma-70 family RNA polymerase sigma factor [Pirellulaceae bacterium]|nr:sigma-70 family RNA polymerase sigma factor [Pirellulaceae bacterium]
MVAKSGQRQRWVLQALEQYEARLLRFAARLLGDDDSARDAVQHTFLRLCDQPPERLDGRVGPWLFAVCRNQAVDMLRRRGGESNCDETVLDDCPDPADAAERADLSECVNRLIDRLPLPQREALALWSEGFSYRQIAAATGAAEGNVRVIVHRALKSLRKNPALQRLMDQ